MADFDFSPLRPREREAEEQEPSSADEPDAAEPTVPPADAEPAEVAAARLFGRPPDAVWRYRNVDGALAYCVCRWDSGGGRKEIRPLSWFEGAGWRFRAWQIPRPLYNLDKIVANPDAPGIVCEGEKAADAASRIFPDRIATTSSGGANAASKTDWTSLAGRRVLVWPDNDEAGATYASQAAAILAEHGCDASIIDADALARIDPNGGAREPTKEGWDAADAVAERTDIEALRKAAIGLAKSFDPGPAYLSFPPYTMDADGLTIEKKVGRAKQAQTLWVSAPFEVVGECRDPHGRSWGKTLRWRDADTREHMRYVADAALQGDPGALCAGLADHGLRIDPAGQRDLVRYLSTAWVKQRVTIVQRTGWHEIGNRLVFVLPGETIGLCGERVILDAAAHRPYATHGSFENWRDGVAKLASGHVLTVLAISTALAGRCCTWSATRVAAFIFLGRRQSARRRSC
jgi:hypothetical protein